MNRGGIPLHSVPSSGQFLSLPRQAMWANDTEFQSIDERAEQPYANLATTDLPESLQQKLKSARPKYGPQGAMKAALLATAQRCESNLPSPPPLPPPKLFHRSEYHDASPKRHLPLPPNRPVQVSKDESCSDASDVEIDSCVDYVEVENQPEVAPEAELQRPYPYELSVMPKTMGFPHAEPTHKAEDPPPQTRDSCGLDDKQALQSTKPTAKEIPAEFILNLEYDCRFVEHKGAQIRPFYYWVLGLVYKCSLLCVYNGLLLVTGIALAFCWGVIYAVVAFVHVWMLMPLQAIHLLCIKGCCQLLLEPMQTCCETISKACRVKGN